MKNKIAIIDYGMSNMFSMKNALDRLGFETSITSDPSLLAKSDGAVLPGVGSFPEAVNKLDDLGLSEEIKSFIHSKRPFLGVCLGFQLLFETSNEYGSNSGLGIFPGSVAGLVDSLDNKRVPHVGWNLAERTKREGVADSLNPFKDIGTGEYFYFVHSFYAQPTLAVDVYTRTRYGGFDFCSSILRENVFACQFHPEKSGEAGIQVLSNIFSF